MRIITYGDIKKIQQLKTFTCKYCGCIFEADKTEYQVASQYNDIYYYIKCPFCSKTVYSETEE